MDNSVSGLDVSACVRAHSEHLSTFCGGFMVQCVKLMLNKFVVFSI